jgi:hypothetical protein
MGPAIVTTAVDDAARQKWERDGWCLLDGIFSPEEMEAAQAALPALFPTAQEFAADADPVRNAPFRNDSHRVLPRFPFEDAALNALVVHEQVIDLAERWLGVPDPRMYQAMVSAKYGGGALSDEQLLHADFANHTLVVPRHEPGYQQLEMFVYLNDVTPETGATRLVALPLTDGIPVERTYLSPSDYADLYAAEVPATGPAGSVLAYRPDVYHRGVRMSAPGTARFMLHVSYRPPGAEWLNSFGLPNAGEDMAWYRFVATASVRQLCALGFPAPGDLYWTAATLAGTAARYPMLDMTPWRKGPSKVSPSGAISRRY